MSDTRFDLTGLGTQFDAQSEYGVQNIQPE
jgi:hypothetical protein